MIQFFGEEGHAIFAVESTSGLNDKTQGKLSWLFDNSPFINEKSISGNYTGPRANMLTPWSTNAVEIIQNMGVNNVLRIEKYFSENNSLHFDSMLQEKFSKLDQSIFSLNDSPNPVLNIDNISEFNQKEGLALNKNEIKYLENLALKLERKLTDSEVFGFSQVNSEHCRHKIFNGKFKINGKLKTSVQDKLGFVPVQKLMDLRLVE